MSLPDLATLDDVSAILQRDLTQQEETYVARLLSQASALVRSWTRQTISQVVDDVVTLPGNWSNVLELPQRPVASVKSVLINGATSPSTSWKLVDNRLFLSTGPYQPDYGAMPFQGPMLWGPAGSTYGPQATGATWQGPSAQVTVTYTHGYSDTPADITNVVAGMVALAVASPVGVNMEKLGGYQVAYTRSEGGSMAIQEADKAILKKYRVYAVSSDVAPLR